MSQPSIASYFHSRKRAAVDEIFNAKNKVIVVDQKVDNLALNGPPKNNRIFEGDALCAIPVTDTQLSDCKLTVPKAIGKIHTENVTNTSPQLTAELSTRGRKTPTLAGRQKRCLKRNIDAKKLSDSQPKIVRFTLAGHLSPKKKLIRDQSSALDKPVTSIAAALFATKDNLNNSDRGMKTPTKEEQVARATSEKLNTVRNNLSLDEIKTKITKSTRLQELKASMSKLQALEDSRQKLINNSSSRNAKTDKHSLCDQQSNRAAQILGQSLKQFSTIDLEVLSSPQKGLSTPTSSPVLARNNKQDELMSPKKTATPRRLFSPTKSSPTKATVTTATVPAHQRFASLAEAGRPTLQMPYKYRCLAETFKCLDTVCSMFFNRHESITMKKLKPAVQRLLRKNFTETQLAQIHHLYPDAYKFQQKKMLNAGSHTKYDYYQLVITPNVQQIHGIPATKGINKGKCTPNKPNEDDIIRSGQEQSMNPQILIERLQKFNALLLDVVKADHDKFLRSLDPPMIIAPDKITRWHAEYDLQNCPDIEQAELPLPPNIEKFSSAKDILSATRNLFNCATPMERVMQRYEAKKAQDRLSKKGTMAASAETDTESEPSTPTDQKISDNNNPVSAILKGVPKSLLERIRAKQAAKALDAMTRRPSQDKEAGKYERLPALTRHLRNIFVTESKSVLELDVVLAKVENSYAERMTKDSLKELLKLLAKEAPNDWITFYYSHSRKTDFVKIKKEMDLNAVIQVLEHKAAEKAI